MRVRQVEPHVAVGADLVEQGRLAVCAVGPAAQADAGSRLYEVEILRGRERDRGCGGGREIGER